MLKISGLCAGYHKKEVIHNIELSFPDNKIITIIGPNGCGKSTLLKTIVRQLIPTNGEVFLHGKNVLDFSRKEFAKRVSFLPQERQIPDMTVGRCVLYGRFPYFGFSQTPTLEDKEVTRAAMEKTGVLCYKDRNLRELSGGERQKVYLAMLIAQDTELILLDEPASFLDIAKQFEFLDLLSSLRGDGKTIIMVLHELSHALAFSDYIGVIQSGKLVRFDTSEIIYQSRCIQQVFNIEILKVKTNKRDFYQLLPNQEKLL